MKRALVLVALILLVAGVCPAQVIQADYKWAVTALGSDSTALARLGFLGTRTEIGFEGGWLDGLEPDSEEGWLSGFYGKYNLISDAPLTIGSWQIETDWYIGVRGGLLWPEDEGVDAYGGAMTGLAFGDDVQQIGAEFQYDLTSELWKQFADREDTWAIVGFVQRKLK